jgi:hypothetical protein
MEGVKELRSGILDHMIRVRASAHDMAFGIPKEWDGNGRSHVPEPHEFDASIESATHLLQELCGMRAMSTLFHQMDES